MSLEEPKILHLIKSNSLIKTFVWAKITMVTISSGSFPMIFWVNFYLLYKVWNEVLGLFLHMDIYLFQHHMLKRLSLLHWIAFAALLKISIPWSHGSTSRLSLLTDSVCQFLHQYHTHSIYIKSSIQVVLGLQFCSFSKLFWLI